MNSASLTTPLAQLLDAVPAGWRELLQPWRESAAGRGLVDFVDRRVADGAVVYPPEPLRALELTALADVRVLVLGQDPYHGPGQAHGLAFSVPAGIALPPSLRNIFKEIGAEYGAEPVRASGNLEGWARQGVLLLNTVLTVEQANAASHAKRGWEAVTDCLIHGLAASRPNLVFMLWGSHAQAKRALLEGQTHCVLEAPHPSPLSAHRGFLGCGHFRQANDWLERHGRPGIDWLTA